MYSHTKGLAMRECILYRIEGKVEREMKSKRRWFERTCLRTTRGTNCIEFQLKLDRLDGRVESSSLENISQQLASLSTEFATI